MVDINDPHICPNCDKKFRTPQLAQVFCCQRCKNDYRSARKVAFLKEAIEAASNPAPSVEELQAALVFALKRIEKLERK